MKKAFFGGSFDPPHSGHLGIARAALASGRCDEVVWFPAADPPHKRNSSRAPFADRINMIKLLINDQPGMSVSDFESRSGLSPSYTFDVLTALKQYCQENYMLLIGADSLLSLHTWYRAEELAEMYEFIIYPRSGSDVTPEQLHAVWNEKIAKKLYNSIIPGTFFEISSTEMKNSMEKNTFTGHIIDVRGCPVEVTDYIRRKHLYKMAGDHEKGIL